MIMRRGALVGSTDCYLARNTAVGRVEIFLAGNPAQQYRVTGAVGDAIRVLQIVLKIQTQAREVETVYQIEGADSPIRLSLSEDGQSFAFTAGPELVDAAAFEVSVKPIGVAGAASDPANAPFLTAIGYPLNDLREAIGQLEALDCD